MKAVILSALLVALSASADPTCTLTTSATIVDSPGAITLTYGSVGATSCTASSSGNQAAWTGSKPLNGVAKLSGIKASSDYVYSCSATSAAQSTADLSWTPPTQNTDGTPLTDLAGYDVLYGATCSTIGQALTLKDPSLTKYTVQGLAPGSYCFELQAFNTAGTRSDLSNTATKTVAGGSVATCSASVHIEVTHTPNAPTGIRIIQQ